MGRYIYKKVITITQPDRCFSGFRKGQGHPASATTQKSDTCRTSSILPLSP